MGGNAFNQVLSPTAFPRIPPAVYHAVKARLLLRLQGLYERVGVPSEAPEKTDHGDVDFLVTNAFVDAQHEESTSTLDKVTVALGATKFIHLDGNRTSHFAVPVAKGEWAAFGHAAEEERHRAENDDQMYYQVDVHVCEDVAEWDRIMFYHSYGDLGMILGLIARNNGFALGSKGLKLPDPPNPPFELSCSFPAILPFFGLSLDTWEQGFKTKLQVFEWATSSRFFNSASFRIKGDGIKKVKEDRKMYAEFVSWVCAAQEQEANDADQENDIPTNARDEALVYFNKKDEFEELARSRLQRTRFKDSFNGHKVNEWAGLASCWREVKLVMDGVRAKVGGDEGIGKLLQAEGEDGLKRIVLETRDELGLTKS